MRSTLAITSNLKSYNLLLHIPEMETSAIVRVSPSGSASELKVFFEFTGVTQPKVRPEIVPVPCDRYIDVISMDRYNITVMASHSLGQTHKTLPLK